MEEKLDKLIADMSEMKDKFAKTSTSHEVIHRIPAGEVAKATGIVGAGVLVFGGLLMLEKKLILG
jgi:hypothetical protein